MKLFLTGAFGNIGSSTILEIAKSCDQHELVCFELDTKRSRSVDKVLSKNCRYRVIWGNLSSKESVRGAIEEVQPDVVLHLGAIIPPVAYIRPELAKSVNVGGTRHIIDACNGLQKKPRIVFASSYSACGSHNCSKPVQLQTSETEMRPGDVYGYHKMLCEQLLKENYTDGEWVILRFGAIMPLKFSAGEANKETIRFALSIPVEQRRHGCDSRDVGLAVFNAGLKEHAPGKILMIGGDDSWKVLVRDQMNGVYKAMGIGSLPDSIYRVADPRNTRSWYFEEWMDTTESQAILQFQRHSFDQYISQLKKNMGLLKRTGARAFAPLVRRYFFQVSPYYLENKKAVLPLATNPEPEIEPNVKSSNSPEMWDILRTLYPAAPENYVVTL